MNVYDEGTALFYEQNDMIVRWIKNTKQRFEPETTDFMTDALDARPGLFVDVGASTGWFSMIMGCRGVDVVAFECNPRAIDRWHVNAALNNLERHAVLHEVALSDKEGEAVFHSTEGLPLTSGGTINPTLAPPINRKKRETVRTATLDSFDLQDVSFIKIDVEGNEEPVLRGARETIARWKPMMVLEANTGQHEKALASWLTANGYGYRVVDKRNMLCTPV